MALPDSHAFQTLLKKRKRDKKQANVNKTKTVLKKEATGVHT